MMRRLCPIACLFLVALPARAEVPSAFPPAALQSERLQAVPVQASPDKKAPLRIVVSYQLLVPIGHIDTLQAQSELITSTHTALYAMAAKECDAIKTITAGECRLVNVNVNNSTQSFNLPASTMQFGATTTFEITQPEPSAANKPAPEPPAIR